MDDADAYTGEENICIPYIFRVPAGFNMPLGAVPSDVYPFVPLSEGKQVDNGYIILFKEDTIMSEHKKHIKCINETINILLQAHGIFQTSMIWFKYDEEKRNAYKKRMEKIGVRLREHVVLLDKYMPEHMRSRAQMDDADAMDSINCLFHCILLLENLGEVMEMMPVEFINQPGDSYVVDFEDYEKVLDILTNIVKCAKENK